MVKTCPTMKQIGSQWSNMTQSAKNTWKRKARGKKSGYNMFVKSKMKGCKMPKSRRKKRSRKKC